MRASFELARKRRKKLTSVDKANIMASSRMWREVANEVAQDYPDVEYEDVLVDAMSMHLIRRPSDFDVIAAENMFGDIISDLAAATVGGMGMAPSADVGDHFGIFQPSHGTAPDIAGKGIANPTAQIMSAALMLNWLGEKHSDPEATAAARTIDEAVSRALKNPAVHTADLGGTAKSYAVGDAVASEI